MKQNLIFILLLSAWTSLSGQETVVSGKVVEAETGSPVPFANVIFSGTQDGTITDFEGNFTARTRQKVDSIEVHYIGYVKRVKPLQYGRTQIINFQLKEDVMTLGEVVVYSGENPAWPIMRNIVRNKEKNDKRSLDAYEYESYTKIEVDVDNITDKFRKRKIVRKITAVLDSIDQIAGEDGKPMLPILFSEAISRFYYKKDPTYRYENILKTKVIGVGLTDGTLTSQVVGSTFQEYNFYNNWMNIVTKEFVSPIADGWRIYYDYDLVDSLYIDEDFCYRIDFYPKSDQDLAFTGTMWVEKGDYALKRIDATVPRSANINFIEKIKVQQEFIKSSAGPWLPEKTRVVVDVIQVTGNTAGMIAKFYVSISDVVVNEPKEDRFYMNPVSMEETVLEYPDDFWEEHRHDSLTSTELNVYQMIDTLKKIPAVKTYMDLAKFAVNGYFRAFTYFNFGPYTTFFGNNDVEGIRLGFGASTSIQFSNKWTFGGHVGYGFKDERWKYRVFAERILDRQPWTTIGYEQMKEVEQVWVLNEDFAPNSLFYTLSRFGTLTNPYLVNKYRLNFYRQIFAGFSEQITLRHERFNPLYDFQYFTNRSEQRPDTAQNFATSEIQLKTRYARDEVFVINDNERLSLGTVRWPAFTLQYTYGFKDILSSDFEYHKLRLTIEKRQKMGLMGVGNFKLTGGYIFGDLPYPLLYNTIGNETPFYVSFAYNLMNYFEFSTDKYIEFRYRHSFEGFFLNRIPLMKKLKLRLIGSANVLYGGLNKDNIAVVDFDMDSDGEPIIPFRQFDSRPYIEVGYGVENILRIFSVEAFHRLTYLDVENVNKFALKFNIQFSL